MECDKDMLGKIKKGGLRITRVRFCHTCGKLQSLDNFRSAGHSRKGFRLYKSKCKKCEKKEREIK